VFNVIIGFAVFNPSLKKTLEETERSGPEVPNKAIGRKAYLSFACYGTFVGLTIMLFVLIIALNLVDYIEYILIVWFFIGGPLLSKRLWNFYSTRLK
jgi:pheromone shutdown protein TraB